MKVPTSPSGEQLIQDYLTRVVTAARLLPKGARGAFVGRTRAQIEREIGAAGTADPGRVMDALAALGEPEDLVEAERLRIDAKWAKSRARGNEASTAAAGDPASPQVIRPGRLTGRWTPAVTTRPPIPRTAGGRSSRKRGGKAPKPARTTTPFTRTRGTGPAGPAEVVPFPGPPSIEPPSIEPPSIEPPSIESPPSEQQPSEPRPAGPPAFDAPPAGPPPGPETAATPPPWPGDLDAIVPPAGESGGTGAETPLDGLWRLARGHVRESVAVVLIGLCGAILPFPFWLVGALVAMFSRLWDGRDKVAALGGPILVVLAGSVFSALLTGGNDNVVLIYTHALHADTSLWIRLGCALTGLYLSWRVYRGKRVKVPPWRR